jgi:predicted amidohydrolase
MFRVALAQMRVDGGAKEGNLSRAEAWIARAAAAGASVVLLPETLNLGWTHPSARTAADEIPGGESCERLRAAAQRHRVYVCAGLVERAGDLAYNSAVLFSPQGELLLHHRKLNELEIAHDLYGQGDRLAVASTPLGCFGVMICADAFPPGQVVSRTLGLMGADVILSPAAWAVPANHDNARDPYGGLWLENYGCVARDFKVWIAGCSSVGAIEEGPWKGRQCIGSSMVVGPDGQPALRGPYGAGAESLLLAEIKPHPRPARGGRAPGVAPARADRGGQAAVC